MGFPFASVGVQDLSCMYFQEFAPGKINLALQFWLNLMALTLRRGNDHKGWLVAATVAVLVCATVPLDDGAGLALCRP